MFDIESSVVSRIRNKNYDTLRVTFPNINFTTTDRESTNPKFPTVYVHEQASKEVGCDLEGDNINAVETAIIVTVKDNVSMTNTTKVMNAVVNTMKEMRFRVTTMPEYNNSEVYCKTARFSRVIGCDEVL